MKKSIGACLSVFCLFLLLLNPGLALKGARQGLLLWADVVLPTLLPFMICSGLIVALDGIPVLTGPFSPVLTGFFHFSDQGSYVFLTGLLCGYPMGAKTVSDFLDSGRISEKEARYLLAVSNHPSPMFILGYAASRISAIPGISGSSHVLRTVILSLYLPVIPLSLLARKYYRYQGGKTVSRTGPFEKGSSHIPFSFDDHLMSCFETMVKIGGYIMLFSILALYLTVFPLPPVPFLRPVLLGFVEITTGIEAISRSVPGLAGALMITAASAFGGLSGLFQTKSVLKNAGLSIRHYMLWKLLHSGFACLIFYVVNLINY